MQDTLYDMLKYYDNNQPANAAAKFPNGYAQLLAATSFLPSATTYRQREFHVVNSLNHIPNCKLCDTNVKWITRDRKYATFCSNKCATTDTEYHTKRKQTVQEKYGVDHFSKHPSFAEKHKQTCIVRYGVEHHNQLPEVVSKIGTSKIKKYGKSNHSQLHIPQDVLERIDNPETIRSMHHDQQLTLSEIANIFNVSLTPIRERCYAFGIDIRHYFSSTGEKNIHESVQQLLPHEVILSRYRGIHEIGELDIYIPSRKLAVEYTGLYWHNDNRKPKNHLIKKMQACAKHGIRLIHVFEHEWLDKQDIVLSRIKAAVQSCDRIYARNCVIKQVSSVDANIFLQINHMQGSCTSSVRLGLYHHNTLVALMTFGKPRYSHHSYELLRYCSSIGIVVVGGASKLLSAFDQMTQYDTMVSYCDLRWGTGSMYIAIGFTQSHVSSPNYWYFKTKGKKLVMLSRIQCQKHKLHKILTNVDDTQSEYQNMVNGGFLRIWDCGNMVFTRTHPSTKEVGAN